MAGVSSQNFKQLPFNAVVSVFCVVWSDTGSEQVDEQTAQEETEDKLKLCIDNLTDKRWETFFLFFKSIKKCQERKMSMQWHY